MALRNRKRQMLDVVIDLTASPPPPTATLSFAACRAALDSGPISKLSRNNKICSHYVSTITPLSFHKRTSTHGISTAAIDSWLRTVLPDFTLAIPAAKLVSFRNTDQGQEGACTFVGFLNCLRLSTLAESKSVAALGLDLAAVCKAWPRIWAAMTKRSDHDGAMTDLAGMLDAFKLAVPTFNPSAIEYVPVRSSGNREMSFNRSYWQATSDVLAAQYGATVAAVDATPWVYHTCAYIERQLRLGVPVVINALEHSRTVVGYNAANFFFLDNWDRGYSELCDPACGYYALFKGGCSVTDKWAVCSWVRDLAHVATDTVIVID